MEEDRLKEEGKEDFFSRLGGEEGRFFHQGWNLKVLREGGNKIDINRINTDTPIFVKSQNHKNNGITIITG